MHAWQGIAAGCTALALLPLMNSLSVLTICAMQVTGNGWVGSAAEDSAGDHVLTRFGSNGTSTGEVILSLRDPPAVYAPARPGRLPDGLALVKAVSGDFLQSAGRGHHLAYLVRSNVTGGERPAQCPPGAPKVAVPYSATYTLYACPGRQEASDALLPAPAPAPTDPPLRPASAAAASLAAASAALAAGLLTSILCSTLAV